MFRVCMSICLSYETACKAGSLCMYIRCYWESDGLRSISQLGKNRLKSNNKCSSWQVSFCVRRLVNNQSRYITLSIFLQNSLN